MSWLNRFAERQMQKAARSGALSGLAGEGKPLRDRSEEAYVDAGEAVGLQMMAQAGVLPEEIVFKKQAAALRTRLAGIADEGERKAVMAEIARIEMRQAIAEEARRRLMKG